MTSILDSAQMVRARRSKPDDYDRTELTRLLCKRLLEVSRQRIPLAQRTITGSAEAVEYVGLADTADRNPAVVELLDAVDGINSLIAERLTPSQERLDEAGVAAPKEIAELLAVSATDPLSLTTHEGEKRIRAIADSVERRSAEIAELAAMQANWAKALAITALQLDALRDATQRAAQIRARAEQVVVAGPLPVHTDAEPGLLDCRRELKGRLTAHQAKAARLGLGEDPDLLASNRIAAGLLSRQPCDLRAVTRAITDYQQMIVEKWGKAR